MFENELPKLLSFLQGELDTIKIFKVFPRYTALIFAAMLESQKVNVYIRLRKHHNAILKNFLFKPPSK